MTGKNEQIEREELRAARPILIRALSIIAAIVALAVSVSPASAGTPEAAKGACHVPGFMDYTDDSCMAKPRWGSAPASALASRSGGEVVSDFAKSKPKPAGVYDHGITQGRKPPPRGTAGSTLIGEVAFPKARGAGVIESLSQKYTASALVENQNLGGIIKAKESSPRHLITQSGNDTITIDLKAPTRRTLGAANDVSHLSLRKAPPTPRGVIGYQPNGGLAHRDRKAKAPRPGIRNFTLDVATSEVFVANRIEGTIRGVVTGRYGDGKFGGR